MADLFAMGRDPDSNVFAAAVVAQAEAVPVPVPVSVSAPFATRGPAEREVKIFPLSRSSESLGKHRIGSGGGGGGGGGAAQLYVDSCRDIGIMPMEIAEAAADENWTQFRRGPDCVYVETSFASPLYVPHFLSIRERKSQQDLAAAENGYVKALSSSRDLKREQWYTKAKMNPSETVKLAIPIGMHTADLRLLPGERIGPFKLDAACRHVIENRSPVDVLVVGMHCDGYLSSEPRFNISLSPNARICIQNVNFKISIIAPDGALTASGRKRKRKKGEGAVHLAWCSHFGTALDLILKTDGFLSWVTWRTKKSREQDNAAAAASPGGVEGTKQDSDGGTHETTATETEHGGVCAV